MDTRIKEGTILIAKEDAFIVGSDKRQFLTKHNYYSVIEISTENFKIIDDEGDEHEFIAKLHFNKFFLPLDTIKI